MGTEETVVILLVSGITLLFVAVIGLIVVAALQWLREGRRVGMSLRVTPGERAEALLRDVLDEGEYQQLTKHGYLDVRSPTDPQRIYRIPAYVGLVRMYEHGVAVRELCIQPLEPLPSADVIAMHKLMIRGDEQEYLIRARKYATMRPNLRYRP